MSNEVGSVNFGLELGASDNGLLKTLQQVTQAMETLDRSVNSLSSKMDGSFKNMEQSASRASKATSSGMKNIEKAIVPTISTLDRLQDKYAEVSKSSQRIGDGANNIKSVEQAMRSYSQMVEQGFQSTQQMQAATANLNREFTKAQQENQKYERAMLSVQKSIGSAERQVATMTSRLQAMGDSEKPVNELTQALQRYKNEMNDAAGDSQKTVAAQERFKNAVNQVENSTKKTATGGLNDYNQELRNLADAAILTYGPLGSVAARVTTFARLARNNSAAIAAFTASIVGMTVSLSRSVRAGMEFERQMLGMEGMLKATGREAEITTQQLNAMAEGIAEATLSATNQTRQAATVLLQYSSIATDTFQNVLEAAQGAASAMGGSIVEATRQFARALEDPVNNLGALTRTGITFSQSQREMIEMLSRTGQSAAAQAIVMERLSVFQELAKAEAQGLAGALDTLGERFTKMYEAISANAEINDVLAEGINAVSDMVKMLTEDMSVIEPIMDVMRGIIAGLSSAMSILSDNFSLIAKIMSGVFIAIFVKTISTLTLFTGRVLASTLGLRGFATSVSAAAVALTSKRTAADAVTGSVGRLTAAMGALRLSMGAVLGAWPLIIAAAITAYGAFGRAESSAAGYQRGLEILGIASEDAAEKQNTLADTVARSNEEIIATQREAAKVLREEYVEALSLLSTTADKVFADVNSSVDQILFSGEAEEDIRTTVQALDGLREGFTSTLNEMASGARDLSQGELDNLLNSMEALGVEFAEGGREALNAYIQGLIETGDEAEAATKKIGDLSENLQKYGSAIDAETLFRGAQEEFQEFFVNIGDIAERQMFRTTAALMATGDTAERAVAPQFDSMREQVIRLAREGRISFDTMNAALVQLIKDQDEAVASLQGMGGEFDRLKTQNFGEEVKKIGREIQLLTLTSDEARVAMQAAWDQQDRIAPLIEAVADFESQQIDATVAAAYFQGVIGIDASTIQSYDDLREALRMISGELAVLEERERRATTTRTSSNRQTEKSLDSLIGKYEEFTDIMAQQQRLASSGIQGVLDLQAVQAEEKAVRDIRREIGKLNSNELAKFVKQSGLVVKAGESVADAMVRMTRETASFQNELKKQENANKVITDSFKDIVDAYEEAEVGLAGLMNGTEAYGRALEDLQISRQVDEITKAFDDLNPVDQAAQLAVLSEAFGIVGLTVENLPEKLTGALKGIEDINREIESQMKIAEAAEKEAARFEEAFVNGMNNVADTFKDGLLNMEDGFRGFAESLKTSLKNMLLDLAYEAAIRPIVVAFQSDVSGMLGMGGSGGGGFGGTISAFKGIFSGGSSSIGAGLGVEGGISSTAITSANQVAAGQASGGFLSGAMTNAGPIAAMYAAAEMGNRILQSAGVYDALGIRTDGGASQALGQIAPIGGTLIGSGLDAISNALGFGSKKTFDFDFVQGEQPGVFGDRSSALGDFGISRFSDFKIGEQQDALQALMDSIAIFDNTLADAAIPERVDAMRESIEGFTHSGHEDLFETRLREIIDGSGAYIEEAVLAITDPQQLADAFVSVLNLESIATSLNDQIQRDVLDHLEANQGDISGTAEGLFQALDAVLLLSSGAERLNLAFNDAANGSIHAAWTIQDMVGGLENLAALQSSYYQTYFTEAERATHLQEDLTNALSEMGMELPSSLQGFRDLVEAQNLNTEAGQENYAQLLQLAGGFNDLTQSMQSQLEAVYQSALGRQADADGLAYWMDQVASGTLTLEGAFWNIVNSAEATEKAIADIDFSPLDEAMSVLSDAVERERSILQQAHDARISDLQSQGAALQAASESIRSNAQNAFSKLQQSVNSEIAALQASFESSRSALQTRISSARQETSNLSSLVNTLTRGINSLSNRGSERNLITVGQSQVSLDAQTMSGVFNQDEIENAIQGLSQNNTSLYRSMEDFQRSQLLAENSLHAIRDSAESQLSSEERMVNALESQLESLESNHSSEIQRLNGIVENARLQLDQLLGIDNSVLTVEQALQSFNRQSSEDNILLLESNERSQSLIEREILTLEQNHNREIKRLDDILENAQLQVDELKGLDRGLISISGAMDDLWATLRSINLQLRNQSSLPGFSQGGIASGPKSGYPVELHGTEAIIPLGSGNIPIELLTPMPQQQSSGITNIITHQYEQRESSRESSEDTQDLVEILTVLREMGEISYEQLVILNKLLKINQRFQIEGIKTQE